jgi:hypothetical protein
MRTDRGICSLPIRLYHRSKASSFLWFPFLDPPTRLMKVRPPGKGCQRGESRSNVEHPAASRGVLSRYIFDFGNVWQSVMADPTETSNHGRLVRAAKG